MKKARWQIWLGNGLVLLVVLVIVLGITYRVNHRTDSWKTVQKNGEVVIGIDDTYVPMGFRNKQGQLVGYDVDLARATFMRMGLKPKFQTIDWSMNQTELATHHIDVIWNGYTITPAREKKVAFSKPYHSDRLVLLTKKDSAIHRPADMRNHTLAVQTGSSGATNLNTEPQHLKKYLNRKVVQYDTYDKAINDLQVGRVDAVLIDRDYANYDMKHEQQRTPLKIVATGFPADQYGVGFRKEDRTLRNKVNQTLAELKANGTEAKLAKQYFGN
ncbi:polar amino acid transport system substrate-binding protein [Weissella uvarum]|uniref:amino acid ABC transporter substrate-binding protein n=1 Tax=Weissella uvarum TaxID=1479233 RepID=UPI00195F45EC|nr:amino acid ABC transporter substrate-binding protein [Weissella uvarum]MBM7617807.1 polar amino acid transport system substrate-binding protein [Weissella uvarum]MCM0595814.1 amino acid ABC transporter substrate-binding protein [Weissella uvarum]